MYMEYPLVNVYSSLLKPWPSRILVMFSQSKPWWFSIVTIQLLESKFSGSQWEMKQLGIQDDVGKLYNQLLLVLGAIKNQL